MTPLPKNVVCIGNSHMAALAEYVGQRWDFIHSQKILHNLPAVLGRFPSGPPDLVISVIGGNTHNVIGLVETRPPFDIVDPTTLSGPTPGHQVIPYEALCAQLEVRGRRWINALKIAAQTFKHVVHLDPPPPIADESFIRAGIAERMAGKGHSNFRVNPAETRYRLWRANNEVFRRHAEPLGVSFVAPPAAVCDSDGFLRSEFWANATHANAAYGELVVQNLERLGHVPPLLYFSWLCALEHWCPQDSSTGR